MERFRAFTPVFDGLCVIRDRPSRIPQELHAGYGPSRAGGRTMPHAQQSQEVLEMTGMTASIDTKPPAAPAPNDASSLSPFRHPAFTVLWLATVVSNIGTWMQNAAAGWLMTGLDPDPFTVSLVQVANSLPMFLFALAGGALADIVDRRRLLIVIQCTIALLVAGFGLLVRL